MKRFAHGTISLLVGLTPWGIGQMPIKELTVPLITTRGGQVGVVTFRETLQGKLNIDIRLEHLPAGDHAVHIHENPVCEGGLDFKTAGGHFNPNGKLHGMKNPLGHHTGDLPENITLSVVPVRKTNSATRGAANFTVDYLSLKPAAADSILGRSIIIHDKPDDMKTDPTGNSGNRIACGVILASSK
jgi:Cu-Zn family superoxide dismutase